MIFSALRTKLIWSQAFRYREVLRTVQESVDALAAKAGNGPSVARASLLYTHHMPFSLIRTRTRFLYIKCIIKK